MSYWTYILHSVGRERYYIGSAEDADERLGSHNSDRARWTKRYQPWEIVHQEEYATRGVAVAREQELKRLKAVGRKLDAIRRGEL